MPVRWSYSCPHCRALLNPRDLIILVGTRDGKKMLVGFHPEPGNYEIDLPPGETVEPGESWSFTCPVCAEPLTTAPDSDMCALDLQLGDERRQVLFSSVAGDEATFVVGGHGIEEVHGADAEAYREKAKSGVRWG